MQVVKVTVKVNVVFYYSLSASTCSRPAHNIVLWKLKSIGTNDHQIKMTCRMQQPCPFL